MKVDQRSIRPLRFLLASKVQGFSSISTLPITVLTFQCCLVLEPLVFMLQVMRCWPENEQLFNRIHTALLFEKQG